MSTTLGVVAAKAFVGEMVTTFVAEFNINENTLWNHQQLIYLDSLTNFLHSSLQKKYMKSCRDVGSLIPKHCQNLTFLAEEQVEVAEDRRTSFVTDNSDS